VASQAAGTFNVACPQVAAQSKIRVVRQFHCVFGVAGTDYCSDWSKSFFTEERHFWCYIGHDGWLKEVPFACQGFATQCCSCAHLERFLNLLLQGIAQVTTCHWPYLGLAVEWIAHAEFRGSFHKLLLKSVSNWLYHDEAFGSNTTLTGVLITRSHCHLGGSIEVRILQHNEGIRATKFQHGLL